VGPYLTAAAPEAAPGALFVFGRYAEARIITSAVAAACCFGGVIEHLAKAIRLLIFVSSALTFLTSVRSCDLSRFADRILSYGFSTLS
jgi:hypothetical protein